MNSKNEIILTKESWDAFTSKLLNYDANNQEKINEYLSNIEQDIEVKNEGCSVLVEAAKLNEDAIISALLTSQIFSHEGHERSPLYDAQIDSFCSLDLYTELRKGYASEDVYLSQLQITHFGHDIFTTVETDKNTTFAA